MSPEGAAIVIQAHFRGWRARAAFQQQRAAARMIQAHASRFLQHKQDAEAADQQRRSARFRAVMAKHQERIQHLEQQKRAILGLPLEQLQQLEAKQHAAATTIQACWRGARQRRQLPLTCCNSLASLRPIHCSSPTLPHNPSTAHLHSASGAGGTSSSSCHQQQQQQQRRPRAGSRDLIGSSPSAAAAGVSGAPAQLQEGGDAPGMDSSATLWGAPCPEESSFLSSECSRLSALSGAAAGGSSDAAAAGAHLASRARSIPAGHRMLLERQVQMHINAVKADPSRVRAVRARQQETDQHLEQLLQRHEECASQALRAARRRQHTLHKAEGLYLELRQLPQQLEPLAEQQQSAGVFNSTAQLPRPGSMRAQRARHAHAMALDSEAQAQGNRWWAPLKALNQLHSTAAHVAQVAGGGAAAAATDARISMQRERQQQEALWRSGWTALGRYL